MYKIETIISIIRELSSSSPFKQSFDEAFKVCLFEKL